MDPEEFGGCRLNGICIDRLKGLDRAYLAERFIFLLSRYWPSALSCRVNIVVSHRVTGTCVLSRREMSTLWSHNLSNISVNMACADILSILSGLEHNLLSKAPTTTV